MFFRRYCCPAPCLKFTTPLLINGESCHNPVALPTSYGSLSAIPFVAVLLLASSVVVIAVSIPSLRNGSIQFLKI